MSDAPDPVRTAFDVQRRTIEGSRRLVAESVRYQRAFNEAVVDSLDAADESQRRSLELTRRGVHTYLDAVDAAVPGSAEAVTATRETVDDQFDTLEATRREAFDTVGAPLEGGVDASGAALGESLQVLNEQVAALLEAHEDVEETTVRALEDAELQFEEVGGTLEELRRSVADRLEGPGTAVSEGLEEQLRQFEAQLERLQGQLDDARDREPDDGPGSAGV